MIDLDLLAHGKSAVTPKGIKNPVLTRTRGRAGVLLENRIDKWSRIILEASKRSSIRTWPTHGERSLTGGGRRARFRGTCTLDLFARSFPFEATCFSL